MKTWIFRKIGADAPLGFVAGPTKEAARRRIDELGYDPNGMELRRCHGFDFAKGGEVHDPCSHQWVRAVPADQGWTLTGLYC